ncbi:ATP-binding cassette domain-containing protein, partial [Desulfovibrio sp. OttesenSCG-928-G11]|nr:ATP-binding cassette domain-containing protein [Desulfovibrio sp. OttesenSCG-928-G11]
MSAPENAIRAEALTFAYPGGEAALENISFSLQKGGLMAVIGPNGGGKSTLLRLILGLLRPDRGHLSVFGRPPEAMRGSMGYVPQFSALQTDFPISVLEMT